MDVDEQSEPGGPGVELPYEDQMDSLNKMRRHSGDGGSEPRLYGAESLGFLPYYHDLVSQGSLGGRDEQDTHDDMLHPWFTAEGSIDQVIPTAGVTQSHGSACFPLPLAAFNWLKTLDPGYQKQEIQSSVLEYSVCLDEQHNMADCSLANLVTLVTHRPCPFTPVSSSATTITSTVSSVVNPLGPSSMPDTRSPIRLMCCTTASTWDTLRTTSRSPGCSDGDPVSAAAHLHLLGESLSLIGHHLQETNKVVCAPSSLSLLLDSLLCALPPLISLAAQIPELKSCTCHSLDSTLENIAYLMPGL